MTVATTIQDKLTRALSPLRLYVIDESARHAGHRPRGERETHFAVTVTAAAFAGKTRIDRHRMIHTVLAEELAAGIHALRVTALSPDEDRSSPAAFRA